MFIGQDSSVDKIDVYNTWREVLKGAYKEQNIK